MTTKKIRIRTTYRHKVHGYDEEKRVFDVFCGGPSMMASSVSLMTAIGQLVLQSPAYFGIELAWDKKDRQTADYLSGVVGRNLWAVPIEDLPVARDPRKLKLELVLSLKARSVCRKLLGKRGSVLGNLETFKSADIRAVKSCGDTTVAEIKHVLAYYGLSLAE